MVFQHCLCPSLQSVKGSPMHLQMSNLIHINYYRILRLKKKIIKPLKRKPILVLYSFKIYYFTDGKN